MKTKIPIIKIAFTYLVIHLVVRMFFGLIYLLISINYYRLKQLKFQPKFKT